MKQEEYAAAMKDVFDYPVSVHFELDFGGSTDFGNVTYSMPACHVRPPSTPAYPQNPSGNRWS